MLKPLTVVNAGIAIAALALFFWPVPEGMPPDVFRAAGLLVFCAGFWATQAMPEHVTGLLFLLLVVLTAVAPPATVFSGFMSGTLWLVLGGLIVAEAVRHTGLGERLAGALLGRHESSYPGSIIALVVVGTLLAFVMPATIGRVLLLVPMAAAIANRQGHGPGSAGYNGLCLAAIFGTYQGGATILPANAPNLVLAGAAETVHQVHLNYGEYFLVQFPVMGVMKLVLVVWLALKLFPAVPVATAAARERKPMTAPEWRLALVLVVSLLLWATDFLHGIRAGWIGLGAGLACMLPRVGVVPPSAFNERIRFGPYFYIGAVLGLGAVLNESGLSVALGEAALAHLSLQPGADAWNFTVLTFGASLVGLLTTNPTMPGVLTPLAGPIMEATGWPLMAVLMLCAVGFSQVLLPYQIPPMVVGLQAAAIGLRASARYTLALSAASFVLLTPLNYLWWRVIGYFG